VAAAVTVKPVAVAVKPPPLELELDTATIQQALQSVFERWDLDRSGLLSLEEFTEGVRREAASPEYRDELPVRIIAAAMARQATSLPGSPL